MKTPTVDQVDDYHGDLVADPYRWLEDADDGRTREWIAAENELTEAWLGAVPNRQAIRDRLAEIWDYPRFGVPFERGGRWFESRNSGLQNQAVLYVKPSPQDDGRVLLDPNSLSEDGTVAVTGLSVTDDGRLLAYATSGAGSDWMTWHVREVETGLDRPDLVEWSKFCTAEWLRDGSGFYYGAPDRPPAGKEYLAETSAPRVFFHRLGTPQASDELVFETTEDPEWLPHATLSEDGRFLQVQITKGTDRRAQIHVLDLHEPDRGFRPLLGSFFARAQVVTNVGRTFYLVTDAGADRQRLVAVDLDEPDPSQWREILAERGSLLLGARCCGGLLVCHHLEDACSRLSVVRLDGTPVREIELPRIASVVSGEHESGVEGRAESDLVHFALVSFVDSGSIWQHDLATGATTTLRASQSRIDPGDLVSEQVLVKADDGALLPLFLTRRRDVEPTGEVPTLLYGYGGFNIAMTPSFSPTAALFVERGGLFAVAVLRGGGEYGRAWHDAGRLANKQRVFDDFADCARFLATSGWSRPERIAIHGRSNGGLLVGACLVQHPELFGAAVPGVGVLDMLRFHRFTIGWAWKSDYGDPDEPEQYRWVRAYSPLHNLVPGTAYPPTLVVTGDHDDRVVPGHSFKFAAALQAAQRAGSPAPILVRIETSAGHGMGKPTDKQIAESADLLAFLDATIGAGASR